MTPAEFTVPERLETPEFRLRMLTVNDVVKDYDAVMSSVEHLAGVVARQAHRLGGVECSSGREDVTID